MSHRPGINVMPSVEMRRASAGTARLSTVPTAAIRSPSIRTTLFLIGSLSVPSTRVPPTRAIFSASAGVAPQTSSQSRRISRGMENPGKKLERVKGIEPSS
jgi:hypothetical protein